MIKDAPERQTPLDVGSQLARPIAMSALGRLSNCFSFGKHLGRALCLSAGIHRVHRAFAEKLAQRRTNEVHIAKQLVVLLRPQLHYDALGCGNPATAGGLVATAEDWHASHNLAAAFDKIICVRALRRIGAGLQFALYKSAHLKSCGGVQRLSTGRAPSLLKIKNRANGNSSRPSGGRLESRYTAGRNALSGSSYLVFKIFWAFSQIFYPPMA